MPTTVPLLLLLLLLLILLPTTSHSAIIWSDNFNPAVNEKKTHHRGHHHWDVHWRAQQRASHESRENQTEKAAGGANRGEGGTPDGLDAYFLGKSNMGIFGF